MREIPIEHACRLLNPGPVTVLSCSSHEKHNAMALSWLMPCSQDPPSVALSMAPSRYCYSLVRRSGEFVLNIPGRSLIDKVHTLGLLSGRFQDKLVYLSWNTRYGRFVRAPYLLDCLAHIECQVCEHQKVGDRRVFIAKIVVASAEQEAFDTQWTDKADFLNYLGGDRYLCQGTIVQAMKQNREEEKPKRSLEEKFLEIPTDEPFI